MKNIFKKLIPSPLKDSDGRVEYDSDGKAKVFTQRWLVLIALCLGYFTWNFSAYRTTPLVSEFALFFNQPNEFQDFPNLGIDFMLIVEAFSLILFYPIGGYFVDKYGSMMLTWGTIGNALACWWWFLSFESYFSVLASKMLSNLAGSLIASSLLRVSNNWFAEDQRSLAVAAATLSANFGAGAALIIPPFFTTGDDLINLKLKSCDQDELVENGIDLQNIPTDDCPEFAEEAFCCVADTEINNLNLFYAIFASFVAVYAVIVMEDAPPTPPSKSGIIRKGPKVITALSFMFSHWNYILICLTDFLASGPPLVLFSTVDRIFPPSVSEFSTYAAAAGFLAAIPVGYFYTKKLDASKKYYDYTAAGYVIGFLAWFIVTIMLFVDNNVTDVFVLVIGCFAILCYVLWTVSVYELKMEYVFTSEFAIQGYVVAVDRTVINLAASLFLLAIPPERYKGDLISGREFTFVVGAVFMFLGALIALLLPKKRRYLRTQFEQSQKEIENTPTNEIVSTD